MGAFQLLLHLFLEARLWRWVFLQPHCSTQPLTMWVWRRGSWGGNKAPKYLNFSSTDKYQASQFPWVSWVVNVVEVFPSDNALLGSFGGGTPWCSAKSPFCQHLRPFCEHPDSCIKPLSTQNSWPDSCIQLQIFADWQIFVDQWCCKSSERRINNGDENYNVEFYELEDKLAPWRKDKWTSDNSLTRLSKIYV